MGRVSVNGSLVRKPGYAIDPETDSVTFDGAQLQATPESHRTIMLNKPRGVICSTSPRQGKTVFELLDGIEERLVPVGRLDKNSEGLLLLSNDGALVDELTHPSHNHPKTYHVVVSGRLAPETIRKLRSPMEIEGYRIRPVDVKLLRAGATKGRTVLEFVLREGRNRQVRRMCEQCELLIHRLTRVSVGTLTLAGLRPGQWRDLTADELSACLGREEG